MNGNDTYLLISFSFLACLIFSYIFDVYSGYQWTNKLEGMFKDVQLSKDVMQSFKAQYDPDNTIDIQLEVNVCTTG